MGIHFLRGTGPLKATLAAAKAPNEVALIRSLARKHRPIVTGYPWWLGLNSRLGIRLPKNPTFEANMNLVRFALLMIAQGPHTEKQRMTNAVRTINLWDDDADIKLTAGCFDLEWQQKTAYFVLHLGAVDFANRCRRLRDTENYPIFFETLGLKEDGNKVMQMFIRDVLRMPAFPIDRWVKRLLHRGYPTERWLDSHGEQRTSCSGLALQDVGNGSAASAHRGVLCSHSRQHQANVRAASRVGCDALLPSGQLL